MNIGITWGQFIAILAIGLVIYYGAILLHFLKSKLLKKDGSDDGQAGVHKRVWSVAEKEAPGTEPDPAFEETFLRETPEEWESTEQDAEDERIFESLELLAGEIEEVFADPSLKEDKGQLVGKLTEKIQAYPLLKAPAFKNALVNLIVRKGVETARPITRQEALAIWDEDGQG